MHTHRIVQKCRPISYIVNDDNIVRSRPTDCILPFLNIFFVPCRPSEVVFHSKPRDILDNNGYHYDVTGHPRP